MAEIKTHRVVELHTRQDSIYRVFCPVSNGRLDLIKEPDFCPMCGKRLTKQVEVEVKA